MIKTLSNCIVTRLIRNNIIKDEIEIYSYGLELLISSAIGIIIISLIAIYTHRIAEGVIYLSGFIFIRKYTGGYHCKTYFTCKCAFIGIFILYIGLIAVLKANVLLHILFGLSVLTIWFLSPCDHENKVLTTDEKNHYKRISKGIISMYFLIICILYAKSSVYIVHMEVLLIIIAVLLIMGKLERRKNNEEN